MESMVQMVNQQMQAHYARNQPSPNLNPNLNNQQPVSSNPSILKDNEEEGVEAIHNKGSKGMRFPGSFFKGARSRSSSASVATTPSVHSNDSHSTVENADVDSSEITESGQRITSIFYDLKLEPPRDLTLRQKWQALAVIILKSYIYIYAYLLFGLWEYILFRDVYVCICTCMNRKTK